MSTPLRPIGFRAADPVPTRIEDVAADWLARREAGLTVDEQAELSRWLLADPRHARAVEQIEEVWRRLQKPRFTGQAEEVVRAVELRIRQEARRRRRRRLLAAGGAMLAAAGAIAVAWLPSQSQPAAQDQRVASVAVRPERQALADGSVVELDAGAAIAVDFSVEQRVVRLVRGQGHFTVAKDGRRPFIVVAGTIAVRAVGTVFAVQLAPGAVEVLVTEGRVAIESTGDGPGPAAPSATPPAANSLPSLTYLDAGTRLTVPTAGSAGALHPSTVTAAQTQALLAWRGMRLEFSGTPLAEIVALFNRRNRVQLALGTADLGGIHISGVFWADDPEGLSRLIEASAGLRADRSVAGWITLRH